MQTLPNKKALLRTLQNGTINLQGQALQGSNYTFVGQATDAEACVALIYKPTRGEQPLWDFSRGTLGRREAAAFLVSEALQWELVPPTVYRRSGPYGPGSAQLFVEHDAEYHYFTFTAEDIQKLRPVALFDHLINNADRKGGHILFDNDRHLWLIDHGLCFHVEDKLRTVVWNFAGEPIPEPYLEDLARFSEKLADSGKRLTRLLTTLLSAEEVQALRARAEFLGQVKIFPLPASDRRPYPWPPV